MNKKITYYSSRGGRENNEDYVLTVNGDTSDLAIVCDGLGGHDDGEVAAKIAADCIARECSGLSMSPSALEKAVKKANEEVFGNGSGKTTASVIWISGEDAIAANVGDTRIYQFRGGRVIYQNKDHSVAYYSYMNGDITYDEIRHSKDRNKLTRALGAGAETKVDISALHVLKDDGLLICSDGFWEYITEEQMISSMEGCTDSEQWLFRMKETADKASGSNRDNNSAIAIM